MTARTDPDAPTRTQQTNEGERPTSDRPAPGGPHEPDGRRHQQPVEDHQPDEGPEVPDEERLVDDPAERRRPDQPAGPDPMVGEAPTG